MRERHLVIIGNYGATNVGDEAVLAGLLTLAQLKHPDRKVTVLSYDPSRTEREHDCSSAPLLPFGFRSFVKVDWGKTLGILSRAEEVWIGGGALFTDEKVFAVLLWGWHVLWSRLLAGKVNLVANTVGPIRTRAGHLLMRLILPMIHAASVRDVESEKVLRTLRFKRKITVGADPAFLIEPVPPVTREKTIIVSLRPWIRETPGLLQDLADWIDRKVGEGYRVVLLPFQTLHDDDRTVLSALYALVSRKEAVELVKEAEDLPSIMTRIASAELVVGMRLHSLILSTVHGTPFFGLSYSDKVTNFCRSVGMEGSCIELGQWDFATFERQASRLLADATEAKQRLREKASIMREAALSISPEAQES